MKKLFFLLLFFCSLFKLGNCQSYKNEIGINAVRILYPFPLSTAHINSPWQVQTAVYTNVQNTTFYPDVYFTKNIYKRLKLRTFFSKTITKQRTTEFLFFTQIYDPNPSGFKPIIETASIRKLVVGLGLQFDFLQKNKWNCYVSLDGIGLRHTSESFLKSQDTITHKISGIRIINTYRSTQIQSCIGTKYKLNSTLSTAYEIGIHSLDGLYPISRLSLNYHF